MNRTIDNTEELASAADALFAWGMPGRLVEEHALVGLGGRVADVNWVPTLGFIVAAIADLELDCDRLVALGREAWATAYPFPDDAEVAFPTSALVEILASLWGMCAEGGAFSPIIAAPEGVNTRQLLFLISVALSARVSQQQSLAAGRYLAPGEYIRSLAGAYSVEIGFS